MKIIVFSDSHGKYNNMKKALDMHPDAQFLLHLGDGTGDIDCIDTSKISVYKVNGNYEDGIFSQAKEPSHQCIEIGGKIIYMCHGHRHRVGFGLQNLLYSGLENNADIILYGHTHVKHNEYASGQTKGVYLFNPGSITRPRDSMYASYGLIEMEKNGILLSHGIIK